MPSACAADIHRLIQGKTLHGRDRHPGADVQAGGSTVAAQGESSAAQVSGLFGPCILVRQQGCSIGPGLRLKAAARVPRWT